jgi:hypothetical protein
MPEMPERPAGMSLDMYTKVKLALYQVFWDKVLEGVQKYEEGQ